MNMPLGFLVIAVKVVIDHGSDSMILEVFCNLNESVFLSLILGFLFLFVPSGSAVSLVMRHSLISLPWFSLPSVTQRGWKTQPVLPTCVHPGCGFGNI